MSAANYERQAEPVQRGESYASRVIMPASARGRLSGEGVGNYRRALRDLAAAPNMDKYGRVKKAKKVLFPKTEDSSQVDRLRQIAAQRAFKDVANNAMQYSKPWLVKAPKELGAEETMPNPLIGSKPSGDREFSMGERTFGDAGVGMARNLPPVDNGYPTRVQRRQEALVSAPVEKGLGIDEWEKRRKLGG